MERSIKVTGLLELLGKPLFDFFNINENFEKFQVCKAIKSMKSFERLTLGKQSKPISQRFSSMFRRIFVANVKILPDSFFLFL